MKFQKFKTCVKCGLFLISIISLVDTAGAANGGIALSWDDVLSIDPCYQNLQLFKNYNATCTINVNSNDLSQGTINNLSALHSAGWEVAAHGYKHQDAIAFLNNSTSGEWLNQEIFPNIADLTSYGYPVYTFVYPYGSNNATTDALLAPYFRTIRSTEFDVMPEGENAGLDVNASTNAYYKWDNTTVLYGVEIDDKSNVSLESIQYGIDYAMANGYVLVLYGHVITSGTPGDYQTSTSKLESILNYTSQKNGTFYLLGDLGNSSWTSSSTNVTANFTVSSTNILMGENVIFADYSVNGTTEFLDFGDGTNSSTATVTHTYTKPGTYNAVLTVMNGPSRHSMTKIITVTSGHTGGIALSWDDKMNIDTCYQYMQMFKDNNATCTINVNSNDLINSLQGTKNNLSALHSAGWEVAAHGHNHADSIEYLKNHTSEEWLNQEIFPNIVELTSYGYPAYSLAYPYSSNNATTDALLAPYFRTLRSQVFGVVNVNESNAYYRWDNSRVVYAVEIDDKSNISLESIEYGIDYAIQHGCVLVLFGHTITSNSTENTSEYQTSTSRLGSILNYTSQKGGKFYLMDELGDSSWAQSSPRFSNVNANFTVSADGVFAGGDVTFADYSVNRIAELLDFGDGSNSSTANVVHTYTSPGTYNAVLTIKNDVSSQSITKTIKVFERTAPDTSFVSNPVTGAPLSVAFTDTSTRLPTSWTWDFGDGANSTERNPIHNYLAAGTYTVNLTATNAYGTASKTAVITVGESSHHSSSSSGGGGGGGSPEPASNVEVKELSQAFITNDKAIQFDFTKKATCVVSLGFDAKKTAGKITTIAEQLKNKSTHVSGMPEGEVYKYFNVWVGNSGFATEKNIENPVLSFKVAKSWIQDKKIDQDSITLNRYSDKTWEQFPASLSGEDDEYLYFKSSVSGYSFFAITGKASNEEDENQAGDAVTTGTPENGQDNAGTEAEPTSEGNSPGIPGFETIYCIIGLLGVFLYRRR
jgi:PGF-pre-PGF domain-containing protein